MIGDALPVPLDAIDMARTDFLVTTAGDTRLLEASIREVGLMSPPVLLDDEGIFVVVCGFRRLAACRRLGLPEIMARVVPPDASRVACIRWAIVDNALQRPLNPIEASRALRLLQPFYPDVRALARAAMPLGLPHAVDLLEKLLPLAGLPAAVQEGVMTDAIAPVVATELAGLAPPDIESLAGLLVSLRVSLNRQRELLDLIRDIAARDDESVADVVRSSEIAAILSDDRRDRNQKAAGIRVHLRRRRFPAISEAESNYEKLVRDLKLGQRVKLIPPRHFEGDVYTLQAQFKDLSELKSHQETLDQILRSPSLADFLS